MFINWRQTQFYFLFGFEISFHREQVLIFSWKTPNITSNLENTHTLFIKTELKSLHKYVLNTNLPLILITKFPPLSLVTLYLLVKADNSGLSQVPLQISNGPIILSVPLISKSCVLREVVVETCIIGKISE